MGLEGSAFFRTNRLLTDRPFRWWIVLTLVGVLAWAMWFFFAPLPVTAASQRAAFSSAQTVTAYFSPDDALKLEPMQTAEIRVSQFDWQDYGSGRGAVVNTKNQIRDDLIEVEISYIEGLEAVPLQRGLATQIIVVTAETTPAELVWQRLVALNNRSR